MFNPSPDWEFPSQQIPKIVRLVQPVFRVAPLSIGHTCREPKTSMNVTLPPFLTTRSVFRSDGKGIWRDGLWRSNKGTTLSPGFIGFGELWNNQDLWKTSQHTPNISSGLQTFVDTPLTHSTLEPQPRNSLTPKNVLEG